MYQEVAAGKFKVGGINCEVCRDYLAVTDRGPAIETAALNTTDAVSVTIFRVREALPTAD
jgi:hypothetical protein